MEAPKDTQCDTLLADYSWYNCKLYNRATFILNSKVASQHTGQQAQKAFLIVHMGGVSNEFRFNTAEAIFEDLKTAYKA